MNLSLAQIENHFLRLCFARELPMEVIAQFAGPKERWELYRSMARHRLRTMISTALPRSKNEMGEACFEEHFSGFLAVHAPRTPFVRDVPSEFVDYLYPMVKNPSGVPSYLCDLLRYEKVLWRTAFVAVDETPIAVPFEFDKAMLLNPSCVFLQLDFPVHQNNASIKDQKTTLLCVFRHQQTHRVHTWTLSPIVMELLQWSENMPLVTVADAVRAILEERKESINQKFIEKLCDTLIKLLERGIVLGSRSSLAL